MGHVHTVQTHGIDDVERTWRRFVPSARLERADPRRVRFSWSSIELPSLTVVSWDLAASVRASIHMQDQLMACRTAGPDMRLDHDGAPLDPTRPWIGADATVEARWASTARVRAFLFDRAHAEQIARVSSGDDGLRIGRSDSPSPDRKRAAQWERSFAYVSSSLAAAHDEPLLAAELQRHALLSTLAAFSDTYRDSAARVSQRQAAPRTVRRAVAYIEAHAREAVTLDDVAFAAGISTRGLQHAFRRALDTTPSEYLRRVRLAGAREELLTEAAVSVRDVAHRWGFTSPSRFARYYRENYGENPAQTARRF
ncbi:MAG: btr [Microbacterium sp.]|jgi:AraC-like DNA-binding protein|nr:btr [Microbacterium sp.]